MADEAKKDKPKQGSQSMCFFRAFCFKCEPGRFFTIICFVLDVLARWQLNGYLSIFFSREKVVTGTQKSNFYLSFWRSDFISCERVARTSWNRNFPQFLTIALHVVRRVTRDPWNRNLPQVLAIEKIDPKKLKVFLASPNETTGLPEIRLKKWSLSKETQTVQNEKKCCDAKKNSQWMCPTPFYRGSHNLGLCLA